MLSTSWLYKQHGGDLVVGTAYPSRVGSPRFVVYLYSCLCCVLVLFIFVVCFVPNIYLCLLSSPPFISSGVHVIHFVLLSVFKFRVQCCDVHYFFCIKTFRSYLLPDICKRVHYFWVVCVCLGIVVTYISCHMFLRS